MKILGVPNIIKAPGVVYSVGGSEATALPAENMATDEPSEVSRVTKTDPRHTRWHADLGQGFTLAGYAAESFALVNHNVVGIPSAITARNGTGMVRFVRGTTASYETEVGYERIAPTAIESSTNATGAVTNVDEDPSTPDGSVITPTVLTTDMDVRLSFPTPASTPRTGAHLQSFVVYVKVQQFDPADDTYFLPGITAALYDAGSLKVNLGTKRVTGDCYLCWSWDASLLDTADGSGIEVELTVGTQGASGPYVEIDAVSLDTESATANIDTGWIELPADLDNDLFLADAQGFADLGLPTRNVHTFASSHSFSGRYITAAVRAMPYAFDRSTYTFQAPGYADVGVLVAGRELDLPSGLVHPGYNVRVVPTARGGGATQGGQPYAADAFRRRQADVDLYVSRDELRALMERLDWQRSSFSPVYVALEPDVDIKYQQMTAFWAVADSLGPATPRPTQYATDGTMRFAKSYRFLERL